jgi:putative transposase
MDKHRRSIRLRDYDYTQEGLYFVTICVDQKRCLFGEIIDGVMHSNNLGDIVLDEWQQTPLVRPYVILDAYVLMPNHFHGLVFIDKLPQDFSSPNSQTLKSGSLGAIIGQFKSAITKRFQQLDAVPEFPIWQRNYYEHIVRNEDDHRRIQTYIEFNPANWKQDTLFHASS